MAVLFSSILFITSCVSRKTTIIHENKDHVEPVDTLAVATKYKTNITLGAQRFEDYKHILRHEKVAVVGNHTSVVDSLHLVDYLISKNLEIVKIFGPEHGFRGKADAGELVDSDFDHRTGLPVVSLYGNNKKPTPEQLEGIDILVFDIQDVGARFYTYISTMHLVMEAAAENDVEVLILDRPNPNGFYVDGPVLNPKHKSFIGMHPVPIVHGMTIGEYATMINEEGWLANGVQCKLSVVTCENYSHKDYYELPIAPSPNLPNMASIYLYPTLCLFEGTKVSVGRGTDLQFQIIGHPKYLDTTFSFTPIPNEGAKNPDYNGIKCYGLNLQELGDSLFRHNEKINLEWLTHMYKTYPVKEEFFRKDGFFTLLSGNLWLREMIEQECTPDEITIMWQTELDAFKRMRKKYLLYEDFE
jgi:uncharacterized protein YbbC (DUF1343 family)